MNKAFVVLAVIALSLAAVAQDSSASLAGTYTLLVVDNIKPDGTRIHLYGDDPQGILTLDASGRYALQIYKQGRPKFAANDKAKGSAEENKAAVQGCNTHFGRYTVDPQKHTITFQIEHASFPNWEGTSQTRSFELTDGRLTYVVATPTTGGNARGEVVWQKLP